MSESPFFFKKKTWSQNEFMVILRQYILKYGTPCCTMCCVSRTVICVGCTMCHIGHTLSFVGCTLSRVGWSMLGQPHHVSGGPHHASCWSHWSGGRVSHTCIVSPIIHESLDQALECLNSFLILNRFFAHFYYPKKTWMNSIFNGRWAVLETLD